MNKDYLVNFILLHSHNTSKAKLELMSMEALIMIKVQIELELINNTQKAWLLSAYL